MQATDLRYTVKEVEVRRGMEKFEFSFRIYDNQKQELGLSSFRTRDGAQAMCDSLNNKS